jgi:hypothetical protein
VSERESGEGFNIAQTGRRPDLLVAFGGGNSKKLRPPTYSHVKKHKVASFLGEVWKRRGTFTSMPFLHDLCDNF